MATPAFVPMGPGGPQPGPQGPNPQLAALLAHIHAHARRMGQMPQRPGMGQPAINPQMAAMMAQRR